MELLLSPLLPNYCAWMLTGAFLSFVAYCNFPASWLNTSQRATIDYLSGAPLLKLDGSGVKLQSQELWQRNGALVMAVRRPGCALCREEARELSKLSARFEAMQIPMYAVLHEQIGHKEFGSYFSGPLLFDEDKRFYGPKKRRMKLMQWLLRFSVWQSIARANRKGIEKNLIGDGSLLGGVYLIGPGSQGILYEHREMEIGHHFDSKKLISALERIKLDHH